MHESLRVLTDALAAARGDRDELLRRIGQLTREVARLSSTATAPLHDAPRTKPSYAHSRYSPYSSPRRGPSPPRSPIICTPTSPPTTRAAHRGGRPFAAAPRSQHRRCSPAQKAPVEDLSIFDYSVFDQQADAQVCNRNPRTNSSLCNVPQAAKSPLPRGAGQQAHRKDSAPQEPPLHVNLTTPPHPATSFLRSTDLQQRQLRAKRTRCLLRVSRSTRPGPPSQQSCTLPR